MAWEKIGPKKDCDDILRPYSEKEMRNKHTAETSRLNKSNQAVWSHYTQLFEVPQ